MKKILSLLWLTFVLASAAPAQTEYVREINKWRTEYENTLKSENGWLTVAGLFWLKPGTNTIGTGDKFDIALTENFKSGKFGEINFENGTAILKVESGVEATIDGKNISTVELIPDAQGKPTVITTGSQTFYLIKREDRFGIRLKDKNSIQRQKFSGLHWFPINNKLRVTAKFEAFSEPKDVLIPNVLGGNFKMKSPGVLKFKLNGKDYTLEPVAEEGSNRLFIIFRDLSSRKDTYGAGRFLYADKPVNGQTILDFNKAENPPCAYTSFATCPLPPPQNRLSVSINAGEKRFDH